jgi:ABC-type amino acid transport/signal transduction systems, periplasmic component/domain
MLCCSYLVTVARGIAVFSRISLRHFCLLVALLAGAAQAETVVIRADRWYPINGDPNDPNPGFMVEIARYALEKAGHQVDYNLMPWERALVQAKNGLIDCVVGAYKNDAPNFLFPDISQGAASTAAFVKKGSAWRYTNLDALKLVNVGAIAGYSYGKEIDAFITANPERVHLLSGERALEQNIRKLLSSRIDVVLEAPAVLNAKLKEMHLTDHIEFAGSINQPQNLYVACTPRKASSVEYVKLIGDGTRELRASGELKNILDKYGLQDWQ